MYQGLGADEEIRQHGFLLRLGRTVLAEQIAGEVEGPAAGLLVQTVGDHAVALTLAPGLQTELEPLGDALGAGGRFATDDGHLVLTRQRVQAFLAGQAESSNPTKKGAA